MGYIILIIVVVAIVILAFVFGTNGKNGKKISLPRSIRELVGIGKGGDEMIMRSVKKHENDILATIREETSRQNRLSGTVTHLGEDIKGVTKNTISKKLDISERLAELCLNELEKKNKIRRMKLSGATTHYVLVV